MKHTPHQRIIDLLPPGRKRLNSVIIGLARISLGYLIVALIGLAVYGWLLFAQSQINKSIEQKQTELEGLAAKTENFKELEIQIAIINERAKLGKEFLATTPDWYVIGQEISKITSPTIKIYSLTLDDAALTPWDFQASATSYREMLIFQRKIEASPLFGNAVISKFTARESNPDGPVDFNISFELGKKP